MKLILKHNFFVQQRKTDQKSIQFIKVCDDVLIISKTKTIVFRLIKF